jgi:hypothetical protein
MSRLRRPRDVSRRKGSGVVDLPAGVHAVPASNGKIYYYWHPNRGTAYAGDKFWQKLRELGAPFDGGSDEIKPGTFAALIIEYRGSPDETGQYPNGSAEWNKNSRETKKRLFAISGQDPPNVGAPSCQGTVRSRYLRSSQAVRVDSSRR